ncbi:hypothetical protein [Streptomyces sp. NPDC006996]|uniref:hypothetical protein n=1 Tax=Streptomyces sp. NPDC006996 TaxID=3156908 RepID=UPI00340236F6
MNEKLPNIEAPDVQLDDELLSEDEILRRRVIGSRILELVPREAITRLQILQPAIGCLNRCNFCSQVAGPVTRELGPQALRTIMGGLRGAMSVMGIERVGGDRLHKDGVIFPYLDNDIGSYPYLVDYLVGMRSLGARTRISTVGWSRQNPDLQAMHEEISTEHVDDIDGVRFSLTPYTHGWRANRQEYLEDFGNALRTYRPLFEAKGVGRRTACIEMRFSPDIHLDDMQIQRIGDYDIVKCAAYSLVFNRDEMQQAGLSNIASMTDEGPKLNHDGIEALQVLGQLESLDEEVIADLFASSETSPKVIEKYDLLTHRGRAHTFQNADGPYFCFNPLKSSVDGTFSAVHYYPETQTRKVSGVLDATRPLLNSLLAIKREHGVSPREDLAAATADDVQQLTRRLHEEAKLLTRFSEQRGVYIKNNVLPLVEGLMISMSQAGLTPADLFRYGLVVDTGVIVNQGKAISEFKGLASKPDMPITPNEEKGYGDVSQSPVRGNTWRISPIAVLDVSSRPTGYGGKSLPLFSSKTDLSLGVFEWNPQTFNNNTVDGAKLGEIQVPIGDIVEPLNKITPERGRREYRMPG